MRGGWLLSGEWHDALNDRNWVDSSHPAAPDVIRGPGADCFFIKSCDYCRFRVMERRNEMARILHAAWLALAALMLAACAAAEEDPTPDYRYRLTVEVATPEGLKTGSSVIEVQQGMGRSTMGGYEPLVRYRIRGEATAVDLPGGKTLYALLRSGNDVDWATRRSVPVPRSRRRQPLGRCSPDGGQAGAATHVAAGWASERAPGLSDVGHLWR